MRPAPIIAVFVGGISREREVSLGSGAAAAHALSRHHPVEVHDITRPELPAGLDPDRHVVFSTLHGTFGEDGGMQSLLETAGMAYAGCDAAASRLTMDKEATKRRVAAAGVPVGPGIAFESASAPEAAALIAALGPDLVLKPAAEGSSVGLTFVSGPDELRNALAALTPGPWLCETRLPGRELTVGLLGDRALGVVEIRPRSGRFDYTSKYTRGATEYLSPAPLEPATAQAVRRSAEIAFAACGGRDFARADFILGPDGIARLLEINTLPGLRETSLLPMSARIEGLDFEALVVAMLAPALARFAAALPRVA